MQKVIQLPSTSSTNNYAAKLIADGDESGITVIMTYNQPQGKGQRGNSWQSEAGKDIATSFLTHPNLPAAQAFNWSMWFSLWIIQFLKNEYQVAAKIKWPNDILVDQKKLAGILIENQLQGKSIAHCITGVGINVNSGDSNHPNSTSLSALVDREIALQELADKLSSDFFSSYPNFALTHEPSLRNVYQRHLFGYEQVQRFFHEKEGEITAKNKGVSPEGLLILEVLTPIEKTIKCDLKEVKLLV